MNRFLVRSACNLEVVTSEEEIKVCGNSPTYKLYSAGLYGIIGLFVVVIIAIMIFTVPIEDAKSEEFSVSMGNNRRYNRGYHNDPYRNDPYRKSTPSKPTKLSDMGKMFIFFGTLACIYLGYTMASEDSVRQLFMEDNAAIEALMAKGFSNRALAIDQLKQSRKIARLQNELTQSRSDQGFNIDL